MNSTEDTVQQQVPQPSPHKPPPCDQCRRRKVKCDTGTPCDRCVQSGLRCTREIIRKRRGPKKGSGSVIAKLRNQNELGPQTGVLPPYDMSQLDLQLPTLQRTVSGDSVLSSYGLTSDPLSMTLGPGSDPIRGHPITSITSVPQQLLAHPSPDFPSFRQFPPLQYPSPGSNDGYVSVSDLAHRIFDGDASVDDLNMMTAQGPGVMHTSLMRPDSNDEIFTSASAAVTSPSTHSVSSPNSYDGPKFLYRHNSGVRVEAQVVNLAAEVGMSAYLMSQCVTQFFRHLYPIMPVLHEATFCRRLTLMEDLSADEKCLLLSICAITVLHAAPSSDLSLDGKKDLGRQFLSHALTLRRSSEWIENASPKTIISSFFIGVSYFELKQLRSHHFYLREAIGMALEQNLHLELSSTGPGRMQAIFNHRIFALLFVSERGLGILRNTPIIITSLPSLPTEHFDDEDPNILAGFQCICRLFALLDEKFVEFWRTSNLDDDGVGQIDGITSIQHGLNSMSFEAYPLTDIQKADVLITHQWLRLIFWQASMRQGYVSSSAQDLIFSYEYPIVIAKVLCQIMNQLSTESILVHGLGIFEKIFEVAYTLMDALTIAKIPWSESDELRYLFACLSASPNSHNTYVRMLTTKMDSQQTSIPSLITGDNSSVSSPASLDIALIRSNGR